MYDWIFNRRQCYGEVVCGGRVVAFLQGEEACALDDEVEACATAEDVDRILSEYDY